MFTRTFAFGIFDGMSALYDYPTCWAPSENYDNPQNDEENYELAKKGHSSMNGKDGVESGASQA